MSNPAKSVLLPTEMSAFLRVCEKHAYRASDFELKVRFHRATDTLLHSDDNVVRVTYKKSGVEKFYTRHIAPKWTIVFDLDLHSRYFAGDGESQRPRVNLTESSQQSQ
jgi:hypothetical protein